MARTAYNDKPFERLCNVCPFPLGECYREGRCRDGLALYAPRPRQFVVPIFEADLTAFTPDSLVASDATCRNEVVVMARPNLPKPRSDRRAADHWIRLAAQEAAEHAGICNPSGCICPNCREYQEVRRRAVDFFDKGYFPALGEAWHAAMDEVTGGATTWMRPRAQPTPSDAAPRNEYAKPVAVVVSTPTTKGGSWIEKRFGVLDV